MRKRLIGQRGPADRLTHSISATAPDRNVDSNRYIYKDTRVLNDYASSAIVPCTNLARAKAFYGDILGLPLLADHGTGFVFGTGATKLNIYMSDYAGTNRANAVVWAVGDEIEEIAANLRIKGVTLDEYPDGFDKVVEGVHVRGKLSVIWFSDPDGNVLHVTSGHEN